METQSARPRMAWEQFKTTIMWRLLVGQRRWFLALALLVGTGGGVSFSILQTIKQYFDNLSAVHPLPLSHYVGSLRVLALLAGVLGLATAQVVARVLYEIEYQLRLWLYRRLQDRDLKALDQLPTGQLITRAVTDLNYLEQLTLILPGVILVAGLVLVVVAILLSINVPMTLVVLAAVPLNIAIARRAVDRLRGLSWVALDRRARVTTSIDEAVRGVRVVKAFAREDVERSKVARWALEAYSVAMSRVYLLARFSLVLRGVPVLLTAALVSGLSWFAVHQHLTIGQYVIFLPIGAGVILGTGLFDDLISGWQFARVGSGRIFEMVDLPPSAAAPVAPPDLDDSGIETEDLAAASADGTEVRGVDLAVGPGELVVARGRGDEVSALAQVLAGRQAPQGGLVRLCGAAPAGLVGPQRREVVLLLEQEPFLFGRTVRDNLTLALPDGESVADEVLLEAVHAAGAADVVDELGGLDGRVSERGLALSGGRRQRLALARALVWPARVLVLDDALDAVHPALRDEILGGIKDSSPGMAVLYLTRGNAGAAVADRVVDLPPASRGTATRAAVGAGGPRFEAPSDPLVTASVEALSHRQERPPVPDAVATASDRPPTVPNLVRPVWRGLLSTSLALLVVTVLGLVPTGLNKFVIDGIHDHTTAPANRVALVLTGLSVVVGLGQYWLRVATTRVSQSVLYLLRRRLFQRLTRLGLDYYDREAPGEVAARVVYDLDTVEGFIEANLYNLVVQMSLLVGILVLFFFWSRPVFYSVIVYLPAILLVSVIAVPLAAKAYEWTRRALGEVLSRFHEDFLGRHVIAGHGSANRSFEGFKQAAWDLRSARARAAWVTNSYNGAVTLLANLALAALLASAGRLTSLHRLSIGSTGALAGYLQAAVAPLPALFGILQAYLLARASFRTMGQPFRAPIHPSEASDYQPCPPLSGAVAFEDGSFRYPGTRRLVLDGVGLELGPGEVVAVVGRTGAGKSSVAKLLARLYDPDMGRVTVDGMELADLDPDSFRRRLGVVPQESFCFRGSLRENLVLAQPDATDAELRSVLEEVGAAELLELPGGLAFFVEESGTNLSASQRQMVALGRMWLHSPDVLVLDEATSNLDAGTEEALMAAIRRRGSATLAVTHHLTMVRLADRAVVLEEGRVVGVGTHEELVATCPVYADLWSPHDLVAAGD